MAAERTWLSEFSAGSFDEIDGWMDEGVLELLQATDEVQGALGVEGGVAEIGVYRGKFFIAMNGLVSDPSAQSIAIDLFGQQDLNIDNSGDSDKAIFQANLEKYDRHGGANVVLLEADTTLLAPEDVLAHINVRPRMFSVDGGHRPEHTIADLKIASAIIGPYGMVFLDDILNAHWLGVFEGAVTFLQGRPTLWPVAIGYNKLMLCPMSVHQLYRDRLAEIMDFRKTVRLCGYEVLAV